MQIIELLKLMLPQVGGGNNCQYAKDGECDVPQYCAVDTDATDCAGEFYKNFSP
jgi:hypothetical protein